MAWSDFVDLVDVAVADAFGDTVTLTLTEGGGSLPVTAVFDREYVEIAVDDEVAVSSARPSLWLRVADAGGSPRKGGQWVVNGITYSITDVRPDGPGAVRCFGVEA